MSGRSLHERDGVLITNRKTDRRQGAKRSAPERLHDLNLKVLRSNRSPGGAPSAHMAFLLPRSLQGFVTTGQHGIGVNVLARGFVQITGHSAEQCFGLARDFFADVARGRPAFTAYASLMSSKQPDRTFGRHLTVVAGNLIVCAGYVTPQVFEARP